ncbi:DUF2905 family protein [Pseudomonadota bacterium]
MQGDNSGLKQLVQRVLVIVGVLCLLAALLWRWLSKRPLSRPPGDFLVEKENLKIYLPLLLFAVGL